jgi:hypothetical protein
MGVKVLTKVQYGLEAAHGTAVAADTMLLCTVGIPEDDRQVHIPEVDMGVRTNLLLDAAVVRKLVADGLSIEDADGAYFQLFPLLFSCCLLGNVTPGGAFIWTFAAPQTAAENLDSFTLEVGDNVQAYEIPYVMVRSMTITGDCISGEVHVSADCFGQFVSQTTITGAIAVPSVEMCIGKLSRIWVDNTWAGLGGTEITNCLVNWSVTLNGGAHPKFWGSANRWYTGHEQGAVTGEATFTFERNAAVAAEELLFRPAAGGVARTTRFVELVLGGVSSSMTLDMAGQWTSWSSLGSEEEGNSLDVATLTFGYDITGTQGFQAVVTTNVASI